MACVIYFGSMVLPWGLTVMVAMLLRVLMTGALHEDGLADFCDGFGGGGSRERILAIMKDSHIGTYGVLGLLFHIGLMWFCLSSLPPLYAALAVLAGDAYSKMVSAQIVMFLPYARTADTAKNGTVYRKISPVNGMILFAEGVLPLLPLLYVGCWVDGVLRWDLLIFLPCLMMFFLYRLMYRKIGGYTGDCCGALFLLVELSFYLVMCLM